MSIFQRFKTFILRGNMKKEERKVEIASMGELFLYASRREMYIMALALLSATVHGTLLPFFTIIFGSIIDTLGTNGNSEDIVLEIGGVAKWFLILGGISLVTSCLQVYLQLYFAQGVGNRLRRLFFESVMRQEYMWFEQINSGDLVTRLADVQIIETAIGEKLSTTVQLISLFITGFSIALIYGWKLTLILLSITPVLAGGGLLFAKLAAENSGESQNAYGSAGAIASEAISLIRTVKAYNGEESEAIRYEQQLQRAYLAGVRKSAFSGLAFGLNYFIVFCTFAVAFIFGVGQVRSKSMEPGDLIVTCVSVFFATTAIGKTAEGFKAFANARGAAPRLYEIIRRKSDIDPLDFHEGIKISNFTGDIKFENATFQYPDEVNNTGTEAIGNKVLDKMNLHILAGSRHAICGSSGSGKSTMARLIERFYDLQEGKILFDGVDIRELNVRWVRSQIGYVGQMPTLFMLSIRDNIALGAISVFSADIGGEKSINLMEMVSDDLIFKAAKTSNAHEFIMKLPKKYGTIVGERGMALSGGQKQRICIARALIRDPKLLILDESTSALDTKSERAVQDALRNATSGRTSITIAHRFSTIRDSETVSVIDDGKVVENGSHEELIKIENGTYKKLFETQNEISSQSGGDMETPVLSEDLSPEDEAESASSIYVSDTDLIIEHELKEIDNGGIRRAFMTNIEEFPYMIFGVVGAAMGGAAFPVIAIISANNIDILFNPENEGRVRFWSIIFVIVGAFSFLGYFLQFFMLGISGERLTRKLRSKAFRSILNQDMAFFDFNSVGMLTTRLATEASIVKGITGDTLGSAAVMTSTLVTGFVIAFFSCWRVSLVVLAILPLLGISEAANVTLISGFDSFNSKRYDQAGAITSEAVDNFDTLNSVGAQAFFLDKYNEEVNSTIRTGRKAALFAGITFGFAEFIGQAFWAIAFWVGSIFIKSGQCNFIDLMKAISGLLFAGAALGQSSLFVPDFGRARLAATKIYRLIDLSSKQSEELNGGEKTEIYDQNSSVNVRDVQFKYPSRPSINVLSGLSIKVEPGQTLALVGQSGCGKSTVLSLIERFYDPTAGSILIGDVDINGYRITDLRESVGFVPQEPDMFSRSVWENIAYGWRHECGTPIMDSMIKEAARASNAHEFISSLPNGYDTNVGLRGSKLSGGQRQRIAIARSLIRSPKLLLLDEATSALDAHSERQVQIALEVAAQDRTTIAVAHRLSTIKNANIIAVIKDGKVVEAGSHTELVNAKGVYEELFKQQYT